MKQIDKLRPVIFKISLSISLAFVVLLFNLSTPLMNDAFPQDAIYLDESVEVIRTPSKKKEKQVPRNIASELSEKIVTEEVFTESLEVEVVDTMPFKFDSEDDFIGTVAQPKAEVPTPPPPVADSDEPILFPDKMPVFGDCQGLDGDERRVCSEKALMEYLYSNIDYPRIALENGIEGQVVLRFVVGKDGSIRDINIMRDIGGGCGAEALRVVNKMPSWTPGRMSNQPVSVIFTLPIRFETR